MSRFLKQRPVKSGLYDPEFEKDSCGVGLVANIKGVPSREIMENAYLINSRMDHSCLLYTSPSPRDTAISRMPSSA